MAERRLYVASTSTQSDAYRPSVDGTLLPAVMDQILVNNHKFFILRLHSMPPLILILLSTLDRGIQSVTEMLPSLEKETRVLHIVLTADAVRQVYSLLTHLFAFVFVTGDCSLFSRCVAKTFFTNYCCLNMCLCVTFSLHRRQHMADAVCRPTFFTCPVIERRL